MKIYAYGIIDSHNSLKESIAGLEGKGISNVSYRDIGITVSEFNEEIKEITGTYILEHERIVERLMEGFTVLPMRFLTVFNTKEDLLSMAELYYEDFKDNLARLYNKVEFGIKVIWPRDTIKKRIIDVYYKTLPSHQKLWCVDKAVSTDSPAKIFVKEKFQEHIIEKGLQEEANRYIMAVDAHFNKIAAEKKLKKLQTKNLFLNASYLVDKDRQNEFKQAFEQLKNAHSDLKFLFSGPWPCYNFVTLTNRKPASAGYFGVEDIIDKLIKQQDMREKAKSGII